MQYPPQDPPIGSGRYFPASFSARMGRVLADPELLLHARLLVTAPGPWSNPADRAAIWREFRFRLAHLPHHTTSGNIFLTDDDLAALAAILALLLSEAIEPAIDVNDVESEIREARAS